MAHGTKEERITAEKITAEKVKKWSGRVKNLTKEEAWWTVWNLKSYPRLNICGHHKKEIGGEKSQWLNKIFKNHLSEKNTYTLIFTKKRQGKGVGHYSYFNRTVTKMILTVKVE